MKKILTSSLFLAVVCSSAGLYAQGHPGIQQKEVSDPCTDLESLEEVWKCWTTAGGGGGGDSSCQCPSGARCDSSITTSEGAVLQVTGCSSGNFVGIRGLKCYYWNGKKGRNEERFIRC